MNRTWTYENNNYTHVLFLSVILHRWRVHSWVGRIFDFVPMHQLFVVMISFTIVYSSLILFLVGQSFELAQLLHCQGSKELGEPCFSLLSLNRIAFKCDYFCHENVFSLSLKSPTAIISEHGRVGYIVWELRCFVLGVVGSVLKVFVLLVTKSTSWYWFVFIMQVHTDSLGMVRSLHYSGYSDMTIFVMASYTQLPYKISFVTTVSDSSAMHASVLSRPKTEGGLN